MAHDKFTRKEEVKGGKDSHDKKKHQDHNAPMPMKHKGDRQGGKKK